MRGGEEPGPCWGSCHVVWGLFYVTAGAVQLVAGLFAVFSLPVLGLGSNIWTGAWNMAAGITSALLAGLSDELTASRQETLLHTSLSVLGVNTVNLVLLEAGEWNLLLPESTVHEISQRGITRLVFYARISTSLSTALVLVTALIDTHVSYCLLQARQNQHKRGRRTIESVNDLEYVIPRRKTAESDDEENLTSRSQHNQNAQSWVFDTGPELGGYVQDTLDNCSLGDASDSASEEPNSYLISHNSPPIMAPSVTTIAAQPPAIVVAKVEHAPIDDVKSSRTLNHMKSFSRTPSPTFSLSQSAQYEIIVPDDSPARTRLYTADHLYHQQRYNLNATDGKYRTHRRSESVGENSTNRPHSATGVMATSATVEKIQYASLMLELEQTIKGKRNHESSSSSSAEDDVTPTNQKQDSDFEFSKELEAALQLLQDLGSPLDTPSEPTTSKIDHMTQQPSSNRNNDGKQTNNTNTEIPTIVVDTEFSNSSSGYSSPVPEGFSLTHLSVPSSTSNLTSSIRNEGPQAIISIYPSDQIQQNDGVTTIAIKSNNSLQPIVSSSPRQRLLSINSEIVNAIYANESLVYLSELELLARYWRIKAEQRLIEQRAADKVRRSVAAIREEEY